MLIKEYRILLPMSVDEYRIAQLYMIQKKSREESHGEGSGVEILTNEPYINGPGGNGQYTHKIYHVGSHLPGWFRAVLPKTALMVEEEAWNAYPYTKTIYKCPFVEKLYLEIETCYRNDNGEEDNIFDLSGADIHDRTVDYIDIVKDQITGGDYAEEEDPTKFVSEKTGRGPLTENWRQEHATAMRADPAQSNKVIMCAYKVCRVEFKYWGMQSKIERFIHDVGLRKTMVRAHRQAWAWQDEYHGLTIEDIRRLEHETALALARKMGKEDSAENGITEKESEASKAAQDTKAVDLRQGNQTTSSNTKITRKGSWTCKTKVRKSGSRNLNESEWQNVESLEQLQQESSDEEFYDAKDEMYQSALSLNPSLLRSSSMDMLPQDITDGHMQQKSDNKDCSFVGQHMSDHMKGGSSLDYSLPPSPNVNSPSSSCKTTILFLVLHGGSIVEGTDHDHTSVMKRSDLTTFRSTLDATTLAHYPAIYNHIATRLVRCDNISSQVVSLLTSLSPFSAESSTLSALPASAVSLFISGSPAYTHTVTHVIEKANLVYHDFLQSDEGKGFNGQVCLIGDSVGSILGYDALCKNNPFLPGLNQSSENLLESEVDEEQKAVSSSNPDISSDDSTLQVTPKLNLSASCGAGAIPSKQRWEHKESSHSYNRSVSCSSAAFDCTIPTSSKHFDFEVSDFFIFGSPLAVVLAYRKACFFNHANITEAPRHASGTFRYFTPKKACDIRRQRFANRKMSSGDDICDLLPRPSCHQVYNLFYPSDPSATRLEPLLCHEFHMVSPCKIPRYQKFPMGDGQAIHVVETLQSNNSVFSHGASLDRRQSNYSMASQVSGQQDDIANITAITSKWWGNKRLDFALYCPDALQSFPSTALPYLLHASFWESPDVVAFILRQVVRHEVAAMSTEGLRDIGIFKQTEPREKWLKRRTTIKVKNTTPNHRANDIIVLEDKVQLLSARFCYGPLDMVSLSGEKIDVHIMSNPSSGEWEYFSTETTDSNGRIAYAIPKSRTLTQGLYPVKMIVKGDHTYTDFYMAVLPPKTECVVFSIDGSFTASVSIMGKDPKVRAGAVDVVRHWQELGYLILYITARPDMQQNKVVAWLAQHNFPHGMVIFMDGVSTDPMRQKSAYLKQRIAEADIKIQGGYGSSKDISVYQSIGLESQQIFINGKLSKKLQKEAVMISDGYAAHLIDLSSHSICRPAMGNARLFLRRGCFSLPGQGKHPHKSSASQKRNTVRKTLSLPQRSSRGHTPSRESSPMLFQHNESTRQHRYTQSGGKTSPNVNRLNSTDA